MPVSSIGRSLQTIARSSAQVAAAPGHLAKALGPTADVTSAFGALTVPGRDSLARTSANAAAPSIGERVAMAGQHAQLRYIQAVGNSAAKLGNLLPHLNKLPMRTQAALLAAVHTHPSIEVAGKTINLEPGNGPKLLASALAKASLHQPIAGRQVRIITAAPLNGRGHA